ncbi:hypothetical protein V8F06_003498 [Rhypophila decipiens]
MARRTAKKGAVQTGSPKKRPVPVDIYEIPDDDDDVPVRKRTRTSLRKIEVVEEEEEQDEEKEQHTRNGAKTNLRGGESEPIPKPKRRGRQPREVLSEAPNGKVSTPTSARQKNTATQTPSKNRLNGVDTPSRRNMADRSARRKSARALIDRVVEGALSDDDEGDGIAREIYESSEDEDEEPQQQEEPESADEEAEVAPTPLKRRGRPPGSGKRQQQQKRSPTPPADLPAYERYFYQNKPGRAKTSNNTLSSLDLLTHDEYFSVLRQTQDHHAQNIRFLESLHAESFPQWYFELSQGFTVCLYGYGSKRRLMHQFATYISTKQKQPSQSQKIVIINGFIRTLTIREILSTVSSAVDPTQKLPSSNPQVMIQHLIRLLNSQPPETSISLFINSIDAPPLRKPATQSILSQLSSHPKVKTVVSTDTSDFPLLWDSGLRSSFNFTFHDCTTFFPLAGTATSPGGGEIDVVDEVHELLGRMARRAGGKDGVSFVLRSLPENAKNLFKLLVTEVLVAMDDDDGSADAQGAAVEYRMMYNKAVEEFICSSEMAFRTLLKEFHDHQIIESSKDSLGTELLALPFRKDELESILEDLMA